MKLTKLFKMIASDKEVMNFPLINEVVIKTWLKQPGLEETLKVGEIYLYLNASGKDVYDDDVYVRDVFFYIFNKEEDCYEPMKNDQGFNIRNYKPLTEEIFIELARQAGLQLVI